MNEEFNVIDEEAELIEDEVVEIEDVVIHASQLLEKLAGLLKETHVNRVVVKNQDGRILFELPLYLGVAGLVLLKSWLALGLIFGALAEITISIERRAPQKRRKGTPKQQDDELPAHTASSLTRDDDIGKPD